MERRHGSLLRGWNAASSEESGDKVGPRRTISFRRGLQTIPWALTARLPEATAVLKAPIESLLRTDRWQVAWRERGETRRETFDSVLAPLPADSLAALQVGQPGMHPLASLGGIEQPPLVSFFLGYRREQVSHPLDGYGVLVSPGERRSVLGIVFSSSLFEGRAPPGCVAVTVLAGGALRPELAALPAGALLERIRADLGELIGAKGEPTFVRHAFRARSIPQYNVGHHRHLEAIARVESANPGLFIGGQVVDGISLSQCIGAGCALADRADRFAS